MSVHRGDEHSSDLPRLQPCPVPPGVVLLLACTSCQHIYSPERADFESGNTGCPRCGGWTWIARLGTAADGGDVA